MGEYMEAVLLIVYGFAIMMVTMWVAIMGIFGPIALVVWLVAKRWRNVGRRVDGAEGG